MKILEKVKFKLYEILKKYFDRDKIEKFPCFYINGSQTLPPPLNPLEEEETLRKLAFYVDFCGFYVIILSKDTYIIKIF